MKWIKMMLAVLGVGLAAGSSAQNFGSISVDSLVRQELDSMTSRLNLSTAQQGSIRLLETNYYDSVLSLPATLHPDLRKIRVDGFVRVREQALQEILSVGQWEAYQLFMNQRRQSVLQSIEERRNRYRQQQQ